MARKAMMNAAFSGEPRTIWKTETKPDRSMELIDDFWFDDRKGKRWLAAARESVDGASIPRPLWALVGSPYTGDYRRASIVHDVACVEAGTDHAARKKADKMFYEACRAGGCSVAQSILLYVGVRIGAWYGGALAADREEGAKLATDALDGQVERDFRAISQIVLAGAPADDADEVEKQTDAAAKTVAARRAAAARGLLLG
jgi:hypothetical protein